VSAAIHKETGWAAFGAPKDSMDCRCTLQQDHTKAEREAFEGWCSDYMRVEDCPTHAPILVSTQEGTK